MNTRSSDLREETRLLGIVAPLLMASEVGLRACPATWNLGWRVGPASIIIALTSERVVFVRFDGPRIESQLRFDEIVHVSAIGGILRIDTADRDVLTYKCFVRFGGPIEIASAINAAAGTRSIYAGPQAEQASVLSEADRTRIAGRLADLRGQLRRGEIDQREYDRSSRDLLHGPIDG